MTTRGKMVEFEKKIAEPLHKKSHFQGEWSWQVDGFRASLSSI